MDTRLLPVQLTDEEIKTRAQEQQKLIQEHDEVELQRSILGKSMKEQMEDLKVRIRRAKRVIESGSELRPVEVEERPDYEASKMDTYRLDTNEFVSSRPMDEGEKQVALFPKAKEAEQARA